MTVRKNPFIVIEALDAGGSQTQTDLLVKRLTKEGFHPHQYHFPQGDTATGQLIYAKFLLSKNEPRFTKREQALLYIQDFFSRSEDIEKLRRQRGKHIIVSDRFYTSTMAYQTIGLTAAKRRAVLDWISLLTEKGVPVLPKPTMVILFDTPVNVSLQRLHGKKKDFFENKAKLTAIRASYLKLARERRWVVINSLDKAGDPRSRQDLHKEAWEIVQSIL